MLLRKPLTALLALALSPLATAHHSIAPFDQSKWHEIEGEVVELSWRNPHLGLTLRITGDDGTVEDWKIEGDAINSLMRRGLTRESFAVGQTLRLGGWPSSRGRNELAPTNVLLPDGQEIIMFDLSFPLRWTSEEQATGAVTDLADDLFRIWSYGSIYERKSPFILTEVAKLAMADYDPFVDTPSLRCIAPGMPNAILNPYPIQLIDEDESIRIRIEEWEAQRNIDMVSTSVPADAQPSLLGYSVGRFENGVLHIHTEKVDTALLDDDGIPMSPDAMIDETFAIAADGITLQYEVTVTDPMYLAEPASWVATWTWNPDTIMRSFECSVD